jgi:hypothetical protein
MAEKIIPQDFYVYLHRKATTGEVAYVGKGQGKRAWSTVRNRYWHRVVKKHGLIVEIVQDGLQEWFAFELEANLIALYGRENLCNMTDGGEGVSGYVHSDENLKKISAAMLEKFADPNYREKNKAATTAANRRPEVREKQRLATSMSMARPDVKEKHRIATSKAKKGKPMSERNLKAMRANFAKPILCQQTGVVFQTSYCAVEWLKQIGKLKASSSAIRGCCRGDRDSAYGFKWTHA